MMCTWFKHDSLASRDKKLVRLRADHGRNGVCMFWDILELMAYDNDHWLDLDIKQLHYLLGISSRKDKELLKQLILDNKYELFQYAKGDSSEYITPPPTSEELAGGGYRFTSRRLRESLEGISTRGTQPIPVTTEVTQADTQTAQAGDTQEDSKERRAYNLSEEGRARLQQGAKKSRGKRTISTQSQDNVNKSQKQSQTISTESQEISISNLNDNVNKSQQTISTESQEQSQDNLNRNVKDLGGYIGGRERRENKKEENNLPPTPQGEEGQAVRDDDVSGLVDYDELEQYGIRGIGLPKEITPEQICTPEDFIKFYKETCEPLGMERLPRFSAKMYSALARSIKRFGSRQALFDFISEAMVSSPKLYNGEIHGWRANAKDLLDADKQDNILSGRYSIRQAPTTATRQTATYNIGLSEGDTRWKRKPKQTEP